MVFSSKEKCEIIFNTKNLSFQSVCNVNYNDIFLDIKKIGLIFFEMLWPTQTIMERYQILSDLENHCRLPKEFCEIFPNEARVIYRCLNCKEKGKITAAKVYEMMCKL